MRLPVTTHSASRRTARSAIAQGPSAPRSHVHERCGRQPYGVRALSGAWGVGVPVKGVGEQDGYSSRFVDRRAPVLAERPVRHDVYNTIHQRLSACTVRVSTGVPADSALQLHCLPPARDQATGKRRALPSLLFNNRVCVTRRLSSEGRANDLDVFDRLMAVEGRKALRTDTRASKLIAM